MMRHWYVVTLDVRVSVTATLDGRMCRTTWGLPFSTSRSKGRWAEETSWRSKTSFWPADLRWTEHAHFDFPCPRHVSLAFWFVFSEFLFCHFVMYTTTLLRTNSKVALPTHSRRWSWKWIRWFLCSCWSRHWWLRSSYAEPLTWTWPRTQPIPQWPSTPASARWSVWQSLTSTSARSPCLETSRPTQFCTKVNENWKYTSWSAFVQILAAIFFFFF